MADGDIPAGWYPDENTGGQRYWDGTQWTEYTDQNYPHQPAQQPATGQPMPAGQPGVHGAGQRVDTWLWQSIVATILCCLPLGIAGIVFASRANADQNVGNWAGAVENARKAKMWTLWSVGVGLSFVVLYVLFIALVGFSSTSF